MGRTSDADERLMEAARALFHEHGYHAVGVAEICEAAGVNKGSFYHFFRSKQSLAAAMIGELWRSSRKPLQEAVAGEGSALERLRTFLAGPHNYQARMFEEAGRVLGCPFGNLAIEMSTHDPELRAQLSRIFEEYQGLLASLVRQAQEHGEVPAEVDPDAAAGTILGLFEGRVLLAKVHADPSLLRDLPQRALELIGAPAGS